MILYKKQKKNIREEKRKGGVNPLESIESHNQYVSGMANYSFCEDSLTYIKYSNLI